MRVEGEKALTAAAIDTVRSDERRNERRTSRQPVRAPMTEDRKVRNARGAPEEDTCAAQKRRRASAAKMPDRRAEREQPAHQLYTRLVSNASARSHAPEQGAISGRFVDETRGAAELELLMRDALVSSAQGRLPTARVSLRRGATCRQRTKRPMVDMPVRREQRRRSSLT